MLFCPKCGGLLKTRLEESVSTNYCSCGYEKQLKKDSIVKELVETNDVIIEPTEINPLADEEHVCKKCGYGKAILVAPQVAVRETWGHSETNHPAYICGKCGYKEFI